MNDKKQDARVHASAKNVEYFFQKFLCFLLPNLPNYGKLKIQIKTGDVKMTERMKLLMTQEPTDNMTEIMQTLEQYGFSTAFCTKDGEEVINRIQSERPDVVIMDLFMTHIDSIGVMRAIRKQKPDKLPMFVVYSSFDSPVLEREVMSAGATYFVLKPFNLSDLAENIVRLSKRQRQRSKGGSKATIICVTLSSCPSKSPRSSTP